MGKVKEGRKFRQLDHDDHVLIESLALAKMPVKEIARILGVTLQTIYNELNNFTYEHTNSDLTTEKRYSYNISDEVHRENKKKRGAGSKLSKAPRLKKYLADLMLNHKYSPWAALVSAKQSGIKFEVEINSVNTIYRAIDNGEFEGITRDILPRQRKGVRKKKVKVSKALARGTTIDSRPSEVDTRERFGDWEMDCVIGKSTNKKTLLVLTERKTRMGLFLKLKAHITDEVRKAINRLEKQFGSYFYDIFKTITVDNGSEFKDFKSIEKALYRKGNRTKVYYCHPHAPHERGSNENNNILVRRLLPKGLDFDKHLKNKIIQDTQDWVNLYPRYIFGGECALDRFRHELELIGCPIEV